MGKTNFPLLEFFQGKHVSSSVFAPLVPHQGSALDYEAHSTPISQAELDTPTTYLKVFVH